MAWGGKVIGGTLGFMMGGPLGALVGSTIGHQFDSGLKRGGFGSVGAKLEQTQAAFLQRHFLSWGISRKLTEEYLLMKFRPPKA